MASVVKKTVMVVEDDEMLRQFLERVLGARFDVHAFACGAQALTALQALSPDALVSDLELPCLHGEALAQAAATLPRPPLVVLMSGNHRRLERARPLAGAALAKPFSTRDLLATLATLSG